VSKRKGGESFSVEKAGNRGLDTILDLFFQLSLAVGQFGQRSFLF
jgi:hypothetical protein